MDGLGRRFAADDYASHGLSARSSEGQGGGQGETDISYGSHRTLVTGV